MSPAEYWVQCAREADKKFAKARGDVAVSLVKFAAVSAAYYDKMCNGHDLADFFTRAYGEAYEHSLMKGKEDAPSGQEPD